MPKDAIVTYHYIQLDPKYGNKDRPFFAGPSEALPKSFFIPNSLASETAIVIPSKKSLDVSTQTETSDPFKDAVLKDKYSKHPTFDGYPNQDSAFCANLDNDFSQLGLPEIPINWTRLLRAPEREGVQDVITVKPKPLRHRINYVCNPNDTLTEDKKISRNYPQKLFSSEYSAYTRAINVFEPTSGKIDNVIIFNDGAGYLTYNMLDRLNALMQNGQISANTAVVFVSTLPGLADKYKRENPTIDVGSFSGRDIEYEQGIDAYAQFIDEKLLPTLGYDKIPAANRTLVGSSKSGTASLYMGLKYPDKFGKVVAQAPSYSNRTILNPVVEQRRDEQAAGAVTSMANKISLSCGDFDSLDHAQNLNLAHTQELAQILGTRAEPLPVLQRPYGHLMPAWCQELETSLPVLLKPEKTAAELFNPITIQQRKQESTKLEKPEDALDIGIVLRG